MYAITEIEIQLAKAKDITNYINTGGQKYFCCPFHNDRKPSAHIHNNLIMCQTCKTPVYVNGYEIGKDMKGKLQGRYYSTIDLVMYNEGLDFYGAIRKILGDEYVKPLKTAKPIYVRTGEKEIEDKRKANYEKLLHDTIEIKGNENPNINKYLERRGIINIVPKLKGFGIELRYNSKYNNIVYNFWKQKFAVVKGIDNDFKGAFGSINYSYITNDKKNNVYYVCEGIEDCFSLVLSKGVNTVCLNSINNAQNFIENAVERFSYIITTDKDEGGINACKLILKGLNKKWIRAKANKHFYEYANKYGLKDVNDVYLHFLDKKHKGDDKKNENKTSK